MKRIALALVLLACGACYSNNAAVKAKLTPRGEEAHPLYVGTSTDGEIVVAATHYDAMNGLAVTADEVGQKSKEGMTCRRETVTGSHMPAWYCRYDKDIAAEQQATQDWIDKPRNCLQNCGTTTAHTH